MNCKNCKHFEKHDEEINGFIVGCCDEEAFENRNLKDNHRMSVECWHDGGITVGEMFGCINFDLKT